MVGDVIDFCLEDDHPLDAVAAEREKTVALRQGQEEGVVIAIETHPVEPMAMPDEEPASWLPTVHPVPGTANYGTVPSYFRYLKAAGVLSAYFRMGFVCRGVLGPIGWGNARVVPRLAKLTNGELEPLAPTVRAPWPSALPRLSPVR